MSRYVTSMLVLSLSSVVAGSSPGQQPVPQREAYWTVAYYQIDWPKVDSLKKLFQAYTLPQAEEAKKSGRLLDYRILIHDMAGRDNVVIMAKFSSFAAIHDDSSMTIAFRRIVPDSAKRRVIDAAFASIVGGGLHRDEIYAEVVKQ